MTPVARWVMLDRMCTLGEKGTRVLSVFRYKRVTKVSGDDSVKPSEFRSCGLPFAGNSTSLADGQVGAWVRRTIGSTGTGGCMGEPPEQPESTSA